jgi:hypothetical protein
VEWIFNIEKICVSLKKKWKGLKELKKVESYPEPPLLGGARGGFNKTKDKRQK